MNSFMDISRCQNKQGGEKMKRVVFIYLLVFICLAGERAASSQSEVQTDGKKACPFSIVGLWRSEVTMQTKSIYFDFSPEGWVVLLGYSDDTLPQDFEMLESVGYKLDKPAAPKSIEFTTTRGNDAFAAGTTRMEIIEYSDDTFITRDAASGQTTRWVREQTHRYFLTFAGQRIAAQAGGPAFAMWTVMDGRKTDREALGIQLSKPAEGQTLPVFGPLSAELCDRIIDESDRDAKLKKEENAFMRLELSASEFALTHQIYETWEKQAKTHTLPNQDTYLNGLEFLRKVAESLNRCHERIKLLKPAQRELDELIARHGLHQYALDYIRAMRKQNSELNIKDAEFPWQWRPQIQLPLQ
jgi:hypothetical protein